MKAAITDGKGKLWLEDVPMPEPGEYECLCKIHACASCVGTDQKHIAGKLPFACDYPGILGHEGAGTVLQVGPKVRYLKEGDLVLRPAAVFPGEKLGPYFSDWGGYAEYGLAGDRRAMLEDRPDEEPNNWTRFQQVVPPELGISPSEATLLVTLKEAASAVANAGIGMYKSAVILGAGSVGTSMCRFAKVFGADPVIVVARRDEPLAYAQDIGADVTINTQKQDVVATVREATNGEGVDRIIDTTGDAEFFASVLGALKPDGKAAAYATYKTAETIAQALPEDRMVPANPSEDLAHPFMLDAVKLGLLKLSDYYSHRLPLEQIVEGFEMLRKKEASNIIFEME
jgi:threonine dehydrogenase-like Zn-dependent dehydrogenase